MPSRRPGRALSTREPAWRSRANGRHRTATSWVPWKRPSCPRARNTSGRRRPTRRRRTAASPKPSTSAPRRPRLASARPKLRPSRQKKLSRWLLVAAAISLFLAIAAVWQSMAGERGERKRRQVGDGAARRTSEATRARRRRARSRRERETGDRERGAGKSPGLDRDLAAARRPLRVGAEQATGPLAPPGGRSPPGREHLRGTR